MGQTIVVTSRRDGCEACARVPVAAEAYH